MNYIILGDKKSSDFGLYISGSGTYNSPARDVEKISVPGRNGDLIIDNGRFLNAAASYPAFIRKNFKENAEKVREWLLSESGYRRLEDSYHPDEYRMARYDGDITFDMRALNRSGECELHFDCKPQRFLKSGENAVTLTTSGVLKNPTLFSAKPLIRVYGNGTLSIGDAKIEITGISNYIDIDCEIQNAYIGVQWANDKISLVNAIFPSLSAGGTAISFTGITKIEITPRWWRI